jgi:hypothetical protein
VHDVGFSALYRSDLRLAVRVDPDDDLVGEAVGARTRRPRAEVRIAHQPCTAVSVVADDPVGPGSGRRRAAEGPSGGREDGKRAGQSVQELAVGPRQMDRDRPQARVGDDPGGEVAARRPSRATLPAYDPLVGRPEPGIAAEQGFE